MDSTPKQSAVDMVDALKKVFKKCTLASRKRAWHTLMTKQGHAEIEKLLIHPDRPSTKIRLLSFKEWVEKQN